MKKTLNGGFYCVIHIKKTVGVHFDQEITNSFGLMVF